MRNSQQPPSRYHEEEEDDIEYANNDLDEQLSYETSSSAGESTISSKFTTTNDTINGMGSSSIRMLGGDIDGSNGNNLNGNDDDSLLYEHSHLISGVANNKNNNRNKNNYSSITATAANNNNGSATAAEEEQHSIFQKENNRFISLLLFTIVFICTIAIAFLASPSAGGTGGGTGGDTGGGTHENDVISTTTTTAASTSSSHPESDINQIYNDTTQRDIINTTNINTTTTTTALNYDDDYDSGAEDHNNNENKHDDILSQSSKAVFDYTIQHMPFTPISREKYSTAASSIINPSLFHPLLINQDFYTAPSSSSSSLQPLLKTPFPSGAFYTNLLLSETTSDQSTSYPIMVYPYGYKWSPISIQLSYPYIHRMYGALDITDVFYPDLTLKVKERMENRLCTYYDSFSVRLRYTSKNDDELKMEEFADTVHREEEGAAAAAEDGDSDKTNQQKSDEGTSNDSENGFEMYLVQGSPYATIKYIQSTPVIMPLSIFKSFTCMSYDQGTVTALRGSNTTTNENFGICSKVENTTSNPRPPPERDVTLRGVQFIMETQENLKWYVYCFLHHSLFMDKLCSISFCFLNFFFCFNIQG